MAEMARPAARPEVKIHKSAHEVIESADFKKLVSTRLSVSATLLVALFVIYYGFILLIPYAPDLMKARIGSGVTTVAIPLGVGVIVFAFVLTAIYVAWANAKYDPEVDRLKNQLRK